MPFRRAGRHRVMFNASSDPIEQYLNRPEEREVQLGNSKYDEIFWTNGYSSDGTSEVLAHFDDGTAAVLRKKLGTGTSYLFGLSLQDVVLRNQINRDYDAERHYVNAFEPGSDVWMLMLRAWYESAAARRGAARHHPRRRKIRCCCSRTTWIGRILLSPLWISPRWKKGIMSRAHFSFRRNT